MAKKLYLIIILICVAFAANAQTPIDTANVKVTTSDVFYLYGNVFSNSNSITGKLTASFAKGGYISDEIKGKTLPRLKDKNRLGFEANYGLTYVHFSKQRKGSVLGYYLRYNEGYLMSSVYSPEAYKLFFYGNAPFAGQTVAVSPFRYYFISTRSIGGGIMLSHKKNTFWLGADFVQGIQNADISAENTTLTTAADGGNITLVGKVGFKQSARPFYNAGFGGAVNAQWFTDINDKIYLNFTVDNLGVVAWNNNAQKVSRDTIISFSGIDLGQVLQSDSAWQSIQDSITNAILPDNRKGAYLTLLPFNLKASATKFVANGKLKLSLILNYRYMPGYIPLTMVNATYKIGRISPYLNIMYGGYGGFNTGVGLGLSLGKNRSTYIILESVFNEGWIAGNNASGLGFGFKLYQSFYRSSK